MATMKAVRFHAYGGPQVLVMEEVPLPQPVPDEVLVRVLAAGINPLDWKVRAGHVREWLPHRLPLIPGWDVSGIVEAVGANATGFKKGDEVYGMLDFGRDGAYAEFVAARPRELVPKPWSIDHLQAGGVPLAALTAWQSLFDSGGLIAGQSVLIHGAAGGVGHYAVQMAKWKGARVIGTASASNAAFLRELGADQVIDYRSIRSVRGVDMVLDTRGGEVQQRSWQVLKKRGFWSPPWALPLRRPRRPTASEVWESWCILTPISWPRSRR